MLRPFLPLLLPVVLASCAWTWEKTDHCDTDGCDECVTDEDCVVGYSCCGETFYCLHQDEQLVVCQLACMVPREPACRCSDGLCSFD